MQLTHSPTSRPSRPSGRPTRGTDPRAGERQDGSASARTKSAAGLRRSRTIDICRGLLFACMASTHALTLAGVPEDHWLRSDLWLPNGWATLAFVVLSGYGVGYVFSVREPHIRNAGLARRGGVILAVMFASNAFFVGLRSAMDGNVDDLAELQWWWGFIDLDTPWTISGVLLPTALVLLLGPWLIRAVAAFPMRALVAVIVLKAAVSLAAVAIGDSDLATHWWARLLFLEGLGGFPVLPFLLNGCAGLWLGMQWHRSQTAWLNTMTVFLGLQLVTYASTFAEPSLFWSLWRDIVGAVGKFAWVFLVGSLLAKPRWRGMSAPLTLLGHFGLGSFVGHRIALQALGLGLAMAIDWSGMAPSAAWRYAFLCGGTLALTWLSCHLVMAQRQRKPRRAAAAAAHGDDRYLTR